MTYTQQLSIEDLSNYIDKVVTLQGWIRNIRGSGKLLFIVFRDGTADIQVVVYKPDIKEELFEAIKHLSIESSVKITGTVKQHPKHKNEYELSLQNLEVIQESTEFPIGRKEHGPDFLLSNRHLWIRSKKQWAILRIRHTIYYAITEFLNNNNFIRFDSPILTPNACEGTTTLFDVDYFDLGKGYLSQSGQLYLETGIMSLGRVYDFGPVFRAEKSKTRKHLTEFWMMDAEMAFIQHKENLDFQEALIHYVINTCLDKNKKELEILERNTESLTKATQPFKRINYEDAIKELQSKGSEIKHGDDFGAPEEALITENSEVPVFIQYWPKEIKPFYMKQNEMNNSLVNNADLIAPEGFGEIIGGSQREDDYNLLKKRMEDDNLDLYEYGWYLDMRQYGSVPHSGFGIGLERLITWISGIQHIRETIPFPRMINRIKP